MSKSKNAKIKQSLVQTRERRKNQIPLAFPLKIVNQHKAWFNEYMKKLNLMFLESKWLYNHIIADTDNRLNDCAWKLSTVEIKVGEQMETREIKTLTSQMRQGVIKTIKQNLLSLRAIKEKGNKVGRLKFEKISNSILLPQYGNTYKFINEQKTKVKIQGFERPFRVLGGHQIPNDAQIANAYLVRKPSGIHLHVTCYVDKDKYKFIWENKTNRHGQIVNRIWNEFDKPIGVDFKPEGIVLSNGVVFKVRIQETQRLKRLQRKLSRQKQNSKNYEKTRLKLRREYERITNKKLDAANKIASYLYRYSTVYFQDEDIKSWHKKRKEMNFSKSIQQSIVGVIQRRLKNSLRTPTVMLDRFTPTTKTCSNCGHKVEKLELKDRVFVCPKCGQIIDRDQNAAINMLRYGGLGNLGQDMSEVTPVEWKTAARTMGCSHVLISQATVKQETQSLVGFA